MTPPDGTKDMQLLEQTILVRERLTAIETRIADADFKETRQTANRALTIGEENRADIVEMKDSVKFWYRTTIALIVGAILKFLYDIVMPLLS